MDSFVYKMEKLVLGQKPSNNFQINALDCLRGLAVILVLVAHSSHTGLIPYFDFSGAGAIGVYCFFVLSSFILTMPFLSLDSVKTHNKYVWLNYGVRFVNANGLVNKLLEWRWLRYIGAISFSMYIFHVPILAVIKRIDSLQNLMGFIVVIVSVFVLSTITYLFIERPFLRIKVPH